MSAHSPDPSAAFAGEPLSAEFPRWGAAHDALRHHMLLERCFDGREARWSEALIARTRRHLGGCITAVEAGLMLALENTEISGLSLADALPENYCWRAAQHRPAAIGAPLLRHFRDRAAIGLMSQEPAEAPSSAEEGSLSRMFAGNLADSLSTLALAQAGWSNTDPDDMPMRTDLPAETMPHLVWTVAAFMTEALARTDLLPLGDLLGVLDKAGHALLSRHDEQNSPFARASLFALQAGTGISQEQLIYLAAHRHILALVAIIAQRTGTDIKYLASIVAESCEETLFRLCRAVDFPREVAVRLVLARRCVSRGVEDSALIGYADAYESLSSREARGAIATMSLDEIFRDRLVALKGWSSRHAG